MGRARAPPTALAGAAGQEGRCLRSGPGEGGRRGR
jgi:hypothetical protein